MQAISTSDKATWAQFFKDASVPAEFIQSYANKFITNRIRFDMLADLDRALLNEMGITAIGDCLSILKHAKIINQKIEDSKKEFTSSFSDSDSNSNLKKRSDVAKRIIENYLSDPDAKPLSDKVPLVLKSSSSTSMLSPELISRLNFNPNSNSITTTTTPTPVATTTASNVSNTLFSVTLNNPSSKVVVSSTTDDDSIGLKKKKRSIDDVYEAQSQTTSKIVKKLNTNGPALEYRGLLKKSTSSSTVINLNKTAPSAAQFLATSPVQNKPVKSRLSLTSPESLNSKIQGQISANLENIRIQATNDKAKAQSTSSSSVFDRLRMTTSAKPDSTTAKTSSSQKLTVTNQGAATIRMLGNFGLKKNTSGQEQAKKITPITFSPNDFKPKITPITLDNSNNKKPSVAQTAKQAALSKPLPGPNSKIISLNKNKDDTKSSLINRIKF